MPRTCVYCNDWVSKFSRVLDACDICVGVARKRRLFHEGCREPFTHQGASEFVWEGVRWFRWRGKWRVSA